MIRFSIVSVYFRRKSKKKKNGRKLDNISLCETDRTQKKEFLSIH